MSIISKLSAEGVRNLFTKTKPTAAMSEAELREVVDEDDLKAEARAELQHREAQARADEQKRIEAEAEACEKEHVRNISELTKRTAAEAASAHDALGRKVKEADDLRAVRDGVLVRWNGLRDELEAHGSSAEPPVLKNPPDVVDAALRLGSCLAEIIVASDVTYVGGTGDVLARVQAARRR